MPQQPAAAGFAPPATAISGSGLNPLVDSATALLVLSGQLRNMASHPDVSGLREHVVFAEIDLDKVEKALGLSATIVTSAPNDEQGRALLTAFGMPFRQSN